MLLSAGQNCFGIRRSICPHNLLISIYQRKKEILIKNYDSFSLETSFKENLLIKQHRVINKLSINLIIAL